MTVIELAKAQLKESWCQWIDPNADRQGPDPLTDEDVQEPEYVDGQNQK